MSQTLLRPITCNCVLCGVLADLERPDVVLDFHGESAAGAASAVALSITWWYSPRVRAVPASPELELAGINGLPRGGDNLELRLGYFYRVFLCAGNV